MLVRGRTIVLCIVVLEIGFEYSILYEAVRSVSSPGRVTILKEAYPRLYELLLIDILIITILLNIVLFTYGLCGHTQRKKGYVIFVFAYHYIIVVPYSISGIYLYYTAIHPNASQLNPPTAKKFEKVIDEIHLEVLTDSTLDSITELQNSYCCCGYEGPADYGPDFEKKDGRNATVKMDGLELKCPSTELCPHHELRGCSETMIQRKRSLILVSSAIGLACGLAALLITPCIYASFEYDRRLARARHIRTWRNELELELEHERFEDDSDEEIVREKPQQPNVQKIDQKPNLLDSQSLIIEPLDKKVVTDDGSLEWDDHEIPCRTNMMKSGRSSRDNSENSQSGRALAGDGGKDSFGGVKKARANSLPKIVAKATRTPGPLKKSEPLLSPANEPLLEENRATTSTERSKGSCERRPPSPSSGRNKRS